MAAAASAATAVGWEGGAAGESRTWKASGEGAGDKKPLRRLRCARHLHFFGCRRRRQRRQYGVRDAWRCAIARVHSAASPRRRSEPGWPPLGQPSAPWRAGASSACRRAQSPSASRCAAAAAASARRAETAAGTAGARRGARRAARCAGRSTSTTTTTTTDGGGSGWLLRGGGTVRGGRPDALFLAWCGVRLVVVCCRVEGLLCTCRRRCINIYFSTLVHRSGCRRPAGPTCAAPQRQGTAGSAAALTGAPHAARHTRRESVRRTALEMILVRKEQRSERSLRGGEATCCERGGLDVHNLRTSFRSGLASGHARSTSARKPGTEPCPTRSLPLREVRALLRRTVGSNGVERPHCGRTHRGP